MLAITHYHYMAWTFFKSSNNIATIKYIIVKRKDHLLEQNECLAKSNDNNYCGLDSSMDVSVFRTVEYSIVEAFIGRFAIAHIPK